MKQSQIVISEAAAEDILEYANWYKQQSGVKLAQRWELAVTRAILRIARRPFSGTPCRFKSSELDGLRRIGVDKFPKHLIFYRPLQRRVLIIRVIHGARDLENLL